MISKLIKLPIFKRLIPSLSIRILKLLRKNRGYFKINDFEMFLDFLDPIDRQIILNQEFEKQEIDFLINQIKLNKINYFLDVGANCGYYSLKISKELPSIKILSFWGVMLTFILQLYASDKILSLITSLGVPKQSSFPLWSTPT